MYKVRFVGEEALDKEEITWDKRSLRKEDIVTWDKR